VTRSHGFAWISLNARWLLPWLAVLFISVSLAHVMSSALDKSTLASNRPEVPSVVSTTSFEVMSTSSPASTGRASSNGCCTWD
jgi:hypothetical protein